MTLMALFAGTRVESLADLQRGLNALFGRTSLCELAPELSRSTARGK
jgi:hypothetical protein